MIYIIITLFIVLVIIAIIAINLYLPEYNYSIFEKNIEAGCKYKRYGCCNDNLTTKLDQNGTNCRGF
jgi:hypothetical protein